MKPLLQHERHRIVLGDLLLRRLCHLRRGVERRVRVVYMVGYAPRSAGTTGGQDMAARTVTNGPDEGLRDCVVVELLAREGFAEDSVACIVILAPTGFAGSFIATTLAKEGLSDGSVAEIGRRRPCCKPGEGWHATARARMQPCHRARGRSANS